MKHIDLFSGIGGFALAGSWVWGKEYENIGHSEIEEYVCRNCYHQYFPESKCLGDIEKIKWDYIVNGLANQCYNNLTQFELEEIDMAGKQKNYQEAVSLYNRGLSIQQVADYYGITRQAMWMVLKRRSVEFRDNKRFGKENHFYRGTKASDRAQNLLEEAIERGIIARKHQCESCGSTGAFKDGRTAIQAHHDDYNKPLDVRWLCQKCHHEWHKTNKPIPRREVMPVEASNKANIDLLTGGFP